MKATRVISGTRRSLLTEDKAYSQGPPKPRERQYSCTLCVRETEGLKSNKRIVTGRRIRLTSSPRLQSFLCKKGGNTVECRV